MTDAVAIVPDSRAKGQPHPLDAAIAAIAGAQHGLVARRQLVALGAGRRAVQHRLETGRLLVVRRGVYAAGHRPRTTAARWMAALLAVGEDAALSHRSAAAHWRLTRADGARVDVSLPRSLRSVTGIALHRTALQPDELATHDGIRVTSVNRTLLDLATVVDRHRLRRAVEQAEVLQLSDRLPLTTLLARHHRRPGTPALRALLTQGIAAPGITRSELEERFLHFLDAHGLPRPKVNVPVRIGTRTIEADCVWIEHRLIVELDGHTFHHHREAFERDRERDRLLQAAGWRVVRVTWHQLHAQPRALAADMKRLLASL
jgi:very-short-patch-repair endonuclease